MTRPVFRFAPSPNGLLHLGHALSALLNFELARKAGGRLLLRIEDIDRTRCRPEFEAAIYQDLAWLGIEWEEPVRRQSEHFDDYRMALEGLEREGLIYPAFESRGEIARLVAARTGPGRKPWPSDPDGAPLYPGSARGLAPDERARRQAREPFSLRLDLEQALVRIARPLSWNETGEDQARAIAARPGLWGDVILGRKETPTSYHLAVVIDDALQGVTHVVRGRDLYEATAVHRLLQELLALPAPVYHHHRLVLDEAGQKLAKSSESTALRALREAGATPADIRRLVGLN